MNFSFASAKMSFLPSKMLDPAKQKSGEQALPVVYREVGRGGRTVEGDNGAWQMAAAPETETDLA